MWVNAAILSQRTWQTTRRDLCWREWGLEKSGSQSHGRPASCARVKSTVSESALTDQKLPNSCACQCLIYVYFFFVLSLVLFGWYSCDLPIYAAYFVSEWHVRHYCLLRKFRYSRFLSHGRLWPTENLYSQILPTTFFLGVKYTFLHENIRNGVETITLLP